VGLAIDDFGTGYSSILQLKQLPLTALKIDRAFVMGLPDDSSDRAIVRATLALAAALDITVTAEGVETEGQRDSLLELGCRRAQGFLLARPESAGDFGHRVTSRAIAG
jgi:EAL domain-containing protein (putative c-di-GMP-specific phosphodiesterase class I)